MTIEHLADRATVRQCNVAWAAIDQVAEAGSAEWPVCIA